MFRFKVILTLCIFNNIQGKSIAQNILSLDSILIKIDKNHPDLKMYDAKIKAFNTYAEGARSWEPPKFGAGFFMTPYKTSEWSKQTDNNGNTYNGMGQFMLSFEQTIANRNKLRSKESYLLAMSGSEKENKNFEKNRLFNEAKSNYYDWIIIKKKLTVLHESEALVNFIIQSSKIRFIYNKEKLGSIYKAEAQLGELKNSISILENEIRRKNISVNVLLNQEKNKVFDIDTTYHLVNYDLMIVDSTALLNARSDIKSLEQSLIVARLNQEVERNKIRPDFGIKYDHMFAFGGQNNLFTLMGMVTLPIAPWSSREYKANIKALSYEMAALQAQKQTILNETSGKLFELSTELKSLTQQLNTYEKIIIPALKNNYKTTLIAYEQNTEDLFVLLDAWQALKTTRIEYLNRLQQILKLQVEYEKEIQK